MNGCSRSAATPTPRVRLGASRLKGLSPGCRGELVEGRVGMGGQALEEVAEVGEGVEAMEPGGGDEAVEDRGPASALVAAGEEPVLPADGDASQRPFC